MGFAQRLLLLAGAVFAYHFFVGLERTAAASANNEPASTADAAAARGVPAKNSMLIHASSSGVSAGTSVAKTITSSMPADTRPGTIQVVLNGKDVTSKFSETSCSEGVCETGTLSSADGLRSQKNVLYAIGRKSDGTLASSRLRFNGKPSTVQAASRSQVVSKVSTKAQVAQAVGNSAADTGFLPSAVTFKTLTPGGWNGSGPWIQIGTEQLPDAGFSCAVPAQGYLVVVVDRQTLLEIPGGTQCADGMQRRFENHAANRRPADDPGDRNEWHDHQEHPVNPELAVTRMECGDFLPHSVFHFSTQRERALHVENKQI